nr:glycosyltransferase family 4 protein [Auraticoccus cholistanensis]
MSDTTTAPEALLPATSVAPTPAVPRTGYVLKMYPRFSETFVLHEMLAREADGEQLEVFSLRLPVDGHFHAELSRLRAPVTYLPVGRSAGEVWEAVRGALADGLMGPHHPGVQALLGEEAGVATQALALAREVRRRGITSLHAHFASVSTSVARLASLLTGVPFTFTAHAKDIFHEEVADDDLARKLADAAAVVTISDHNHHHLRDRFPEAATRLHRVHNGIDLESFGYSDPAGRPAGVVAVGRLVEKKGFDTLLDAVALLRAEGVQAPLTLVGAGPLAPALAEQRQRLGLVGVQLLGPMPQHEVRRLVAGAAVFAAPCRVGSDGNRDGLPTVLLEAMALGTPCVATPVTGIPEAVQDEVTGLLVEPDDAVALAAALRRLLEQPLLRRSLAVRARQRVEEGFDVRRQAAEVARLTVPAPVGGAR